MEYIEIGTLEELGSEERLLLEIDNHDILLLQHEGRFLAVENVCSHDGQGLDDATVDNGEIVCPRHGARFDIQTGEALTLPAVAGIPAYPVKIEDGRVYLGIEE